MAFPADDIHVIDAGTITSVRASVIADIWNGAGAPTGGVDSVASDVDVSSLLSGWLPNLLQVDRYTVATTDGIVADTVEPWLFRPNTSSNQLLIVGLGHSNTAVSGIDDVIKAGLSRGNHVLVVPMPDGGVSGHTALFDQDDPGTFSAYEYFFNAPIKSINQVIASYGSPDKIVACSLSGGGWLAVFLAALDTRVAASIPVAGSLPLAIRETFATDPDDYGENEQRLQNLTHNGTNQLEWLDLYLLGVSGGRKQRMIGNSADSCCFFDVTATYPGGRYTTFDDEVIAAAVGFGGDWSVHVVTNSGHTILPSVIATYAVPELGGIDSVAAA